METFLTILGMFTAAIAFRAIWDYLKSQSALQKQHESFLKQQESLRKQKSYGSFWKNRKESDKALLRFYRNPDKVRSIKILAEKFHCYPSEVEACFMVSLFSKHHSKELQEELICKIRESKPKEADIMKIDQQNTPSALLEKWHIEYYQRFK